jgi:plasmid replication initiation protein
MENSQSYSSLSVVKSNRVIEAKYRLGARAQKFILFMASMVNPMDDDFKYLRVKVKDIEPIFNTDQKKWGSIYQIVKEIILSLNNHPLKIQQEDGSHLIVNWIASAEIRQGSGMVEFEFSEKLRPYLLQLKSHFTKYKLQNILQLKSAFSIRLYELLKARQFIGKAEYELDELKAILGLDDKYSVYYDFKRRVLLPAQEELAEFSDIWFEFKERKEGRKVKYLVFYIHENVKVVQEIEAGEDLPEVKSVLIKELVELGFSRFKAIELFQLGFDVLIDPKVKEMVKSVYESAEDFFKEKLDLTKYELKKGKVNHPTGFFLKAIQEDYQSNDFKNAQKQKLKQKRAEADQALKTQYQQLYDTQRKLLYDQQQQLINQLFTKRPKLLDKALEQYQLTVEEYKNDALAKAKVNAWVINKYPINFESLKELEQNIQELKKTMDRL